MNLAEKILLWTLRACMASACCAMALLACLYFFLQRDPAELAAKYLADISRRTGLEISFGAVDVTLLPLPAMAVGDLSISGDGLEFNAAWLSVRPNFWLLLRGEVFPGRISMLRPKLTAITDLPLAEPEPLKRRLLAFFNKYGSQRAGARGRELVPGSMRLEISQGEARVFGARETSMTLNALQCGITVHPDAEISGFAGLAALRLLKGGAVLAGMESLRLSGQANALDFWRDTRGLKAEGRFSKTGLMASSSFNLDFEGSSSGWSWAASFNGDLELAGGMEPVALSGRAIKLDKGEAISLRGIEWSLGADSGALDAMLFPPGANKDFRLSGVLLFNRISLSQWLGFARNLCPGLELALDNVTDGRLEFSLDAKGLAVPRIEASCQGARFSGKGAVASFAKPVVALDMRSKAVDLGRAIPEALGKSPLPAFFPHPPLTPAETEPLKPGETGIGYDIRLAADEVKYGPLALKNASLRVYPGKVDKNGLEDVLLDAKAGLYGGAMSGSCVLGADSSLPCAIRARLVNVNGARLAAALPALPFSQGVFRADVSLASKGRKLAAFLAALRGSVEAAGENAVLAAAGAGQFFSGVACKAELRSALLDKKRLGFDGEWRASLKSKSLAGDMELNGKLWFDGKGMTFSRLPGKLRFSLGDAPGFLPGNSKGSLRGAFSARTAQGKFGCDSAEFDFMGLEGKLALDVSLNGQAPAWQGSIRASTADLKRLIHDFAGVAVNVPQALLKAGLAANFSGGPGGIRLDGIKAGFGQMLLTGKLAFLTGKAKPAFEFALNADKLDLSLFTGKAQKNSGTDKAAGRDFSFLRAFNASGEFTARELRGFGLTLQNLRMPARLEDGKLTLGPNSARLYGTSFLSRASMDFNSGIGFSGSLAAHGFDLGAASRDMGVGALMSGSASFDASLRARPAARERLAAALNGEWSFSVTRGSWQAKGSDGKPKGGPTRFDLARASGVIVNGLVKSGNFVLQGPALKVGGGGWLNLANQKIDCDFNVNMKGVPDFPLRLYGDLDNSKTSIGAGKMVINAIGGITSGLADVFGGIVEGAWKLFR